MKTSVGESFSHLTDFFSSTLYSTYFEIGKDNLVFVQFSSNLVHFFSSGNNTINKMCYHPVNLVYTTPNDFIFWL